MATLAHSISRVLPTPIARTLRPRWHRWRDTLMFVTKAGGRLRYDSELECRIAARRFDGRWMEVAVRSYRELRRFLQFGEDPADVLHTWMHEIGGAEVLYDVGSANGLEGFLVHHLHGTRIVFIEPYTPSIETLLKTLYRQGKTSGVSADRFEIVHAGCDTTPGYSRHIYHSPPIPGETGNSFADPMAYCRGGKGHLPVTMSQWTASVSLDSLHWDYGLPLATHVKMDIDGFEGRAIDGAKKLLASGHVKSWALELSGEHNVVSITKAMNDNGYVEVASWEHYPDYEHYTGDHVFAREDEADRWRKLYAERHGSPSVGTSYIGR